MSSQAYTDHLAAILNDAEELIEAHKRLRTGKTGRQWGLGALNRAVVVMSVSAWEAYLEELVREALEVMKPGPGAMGTWTSLKAAALSQLGRFNNPTVQNVRSLLSDTIGLSDVTTAWSWRNCTAAQARERLEIVLRYRHETAHGVKPRPIIHNQYSGRLPAFIRRLGRATDTKTRDHLVALGVTNPWPS